MESLIKVRKEALPYRGGTKKVIVTPPKVYELVERAPEETRPTGEIDWQQKFIELAFEMARNK